MDLIALSKIAIESAISAGKVIKKHLIDDIKVATKDGGGTSYSSQVVTAVDKASESVILAALGPSATTNDIAILSEETEDDQSRLAKEYFWSIDPMDGTLAFIKKHPGFSVSIALVAQDGTPHIGVVYDPTTDMLYHAIKGKGAFKNGRPWIVENTNNYLSYFTDKRLADTPRKTEIEAICHDLITAHQLKGMKELSGAGAVLNAISVLENGPACMIKFPKKELGGGSIWDYAATACIYNEFGLRASDFEGDTLELNRKESCFMNHKGVYFANL